MIAQRYELLELKLERCSNMVGSVYRGLYILARPEVI